VLCICASVLAVQRGNHGPGQNHSNPCGYPQQCYGLLYANKASTEGTTLKVAALKSSVFITVLAGMTRAAVTARPSGPSKVPRPRMN